MSLDATLWAWKQKGLTPAEKNVLLSLADRAGEDHTAWPSAKRLAQDTELSDRHVRRVLKELVYKGKIRRCGEHPSGVVIYQLIGVHGRENNDMRPPDKMSGGADMESGRGDKVSPKPPIEPLSESTPPHSPPADTREISQQCREDAEQMFEGRDINHLISEWRQASLQKGEPPKYPDKAFIAWASRYVSNHPHQSPQCDESGNRQTPVRELSIPSVPNEALEACQSAIGKLAESDQEARSLSLQVGFFRYDTTGLGYVRMVAANKASQRLAAGHAKLVEIIKTAFRVNRIEWNVSPQHLEALAALDRLGLPEVWFSEQEQGKVSL